MANSYWLEQEKIFLEAIKDVEIPNNTLANVDFTLVKNCNDLNSIPSGGGCYWIWANEPVKHSLHKHKNPNSFEGGEIIYNGIAKEDVKGRIYHHLFGFEDARWSGISLDIYTNKSVSHRKKACSQLGKVPYLDSKPIRNKEQLLQLHLSKNERDYILSNELDVYFFRNGINITDDKHKVYDFKVFYITGLTSLYLEHIEKQWREFGLPKLCSYSSGR
jgi:hypothetical protein